MDESTLAEMVHRGGVMVLSGAGLSTDSGIPDYRGDGGRGRAPVTYRQFVDDPGARRRYWSRSHVGWKHIALAEPNAGHRALASLEQAGLVSGVVTQNVDRLHQKAGTKAVIDLHGSLDRTVCLGCGDGRARLELHHRLEAANPRFDTKATVAPDGDADISATESESFRVVECLRCGGLLKPDVVFFGESVPHRRVRKALEWIESASMLLVVGTSLSVMSGHRFVHAARRRCLPLAIVNRGPTRADAVADVRIDAGLSDVLPLLVSHPSRTNPDSVSSTNLGT